MIDFIGTLNLVEMMLIGSIGFAMLHLIITLLRFHRRKFVESHTFLAFIFQLIFINGLTGAAGGLMAGLLLQDTSTIESLMLFGFFGFIVADITLIIASVILKLESSDEIFYVFSIVGPIFYGVALESFSVGAILVTFWVLMDIIHKYFVCGYLTKFYIDNDNQVILKKYLLFVFLEGTFLGCVFGIMLSFI